MKRLALILTLMFPGVSWATHLTGINANNISVGTLPNERLDPSSVTLLGPKINPAEIEGILSSTQVAGSIGSGVIFSSHTGAGQLLYNSNGVVFSSHTTGLLINGVEVIFSSHIKSGTSIKEVSGYDGSTFQGNFNTLKVTGNGSLSVSGTTATLNVIAGGAATGNSTFTYVIPYGGAVYVSTQDACGFPGACVNMGHSTWNVVAISAQLQKGSTVAWTRVDLAISTGGVNGRPLNFQFPTITIPTATAVGYSSLSPKLSTGVVVNAGWTLGVQVSSGPTSGNYPQKLDVLLEIWKKPYE